MFVYSIRSATIKFVCAIALSGKKMGKKEKCKAYCKGGFAHRGACV